MMRKNAKIALMLNMTEAANDLKAEIEEMKDQLSRVVGDMTCLMSRVLGLAVCRIRG